MRQNQREGCGVRKCVERPRREKRSKTEENRKGGGRSRKKVGGEREKNRVIDESSITRIKKVNCKFKTVGNR